MELEKFCPECGKKRLEGNKFCTNCGRKFQVINKEIKDGDVNKQVKKI
jgi:ribosomal protein L33